MKPTYWPTDLIKISDLLGLFVIKDISSNYVKAEVLIELLFNHSPVLFKLSLIIIKERKTFLTNKITDCDLFSNTPEEAILKQ